MSGIQVEAAILAAAGGNGKRVRQALAGFMDVKEWMDELGIFDRSEGDLRRFAHLLGQTAHESTGYSRLVEGLYYKTPERIRAVFGKRRFPSLVDAQRCVRDPRRLAEAAYGGEWGLKNLGNSRPGDGWLYRGRGYLQLSGRANFKSFGRLTGIDLINHPEQASTPDVAWKIAGAYLANRRRGGKTALEWADLGDVKQVTRIVNGGLNGLANREIRTSRALAALKGRTT